MTRSRYHKNLMQAILYHLFWDMNMLIEKRLTEIYVRFVGVRLIPM
eukprot:COSAG01_NODE_153_length_23909_cov_32.542018_9_plen_46_part_00